MEYLYSQTGKTLTPVLQNPEEEDRLVEGVRDEDIEDEGFEEEVTEDITVPVLSEGDPCRELECRPSLPTSPQAPASLADLPSTSGEGQHPAAAAPSVLPGTSQAALESDASDLAQVKHFNGYFNPLTMTFYFILIHLLFLY